LWIVSSSSLPFVCSHLSVVYSRWPSPNALPQQYSAHCHRLWVFLSRSVSVWFRCSNVGFFVWGFSVGRRGVANLEVEGM
jgi:hypothetical protein